MTDDRGLTELRWATGQQMLIAQTVKGAVLIYQHESDQERKAGYYLRWEHARSAYLNENEEMYLGAHLALVQYNIDQWVKERKGIVERGKYR